MGSTFHLLTALVLASALGVAPACDGEKKAKGEGGAADSAEAPAFGAAELGAEIAGFAAPIDSLTWFGPGREIMVGWLRSVGFVKPECDEVYKSIERSYAVDLGDGGEIRIFVGPIDRAKVMACGKEAADKGLFSMVEEGEALKIDGGEGGKLEARWLEQDGTRMVVAASLPALEAWDGAGAKLGDDATAKALVEHFNPETGMWSMYLPSPDGNRFDIEHRGVVMTNGGNALRMEGRVLFADAAKRDAGLKICEDLYAKAYAEHGSQLRGLLEKSDAAGTPAIRFNLQFSDAELLDGIMRSMLAPADAPALSGPPAASGPTGATGPTGAEATPPPESPTPSK